MPLYKLTRGSIGIVVGEKTVEVKKGQTIELPSDEKAKSYSKYLKRVDLPDNAVKTPETIPISTATVESITTVPTTVVGASDSLISRDWSKSQDMKAPDLISQVHETNSVQDLETLYDLEEKGQNRVTVLREIEKRVATLEAK